MFNKIKTKWLVILFSVLLVLVLLLLPKHTTKTNRSFKSDLADFEIDNVTEIYLYPKSSGDLITLEKEGDDWKIITPGGETFMADAAQADNMLTTLSEFTAKRLVAREKSKWAQYQVTDSLGTRVQVMDGKKVVVDMYIGKFDYQQPQNPNPYSRQQGIMTSYVRLSDDKDVYAVDGFLSMTFGRSAKELRNRKMVQFDKQSATRLAFVTPDGNYNLIKQDSVWLLDGIIPDSAAVADYLSNVSNMQSSEFVSRDNVLEQDAKYMLTIEANNLTEPLKIQAFASDTVNRYAISTSQNEGSYFSGKNGMFEKIFQSKKVFLEGQKQNEDVE